MSQPIIGITMAMDTADLIRKGIEYSYIRYEYGEQVKAAGGQPIFLDATIDPATAARICDGIVISGGHDLHPGTYGQEINNLGGDIEPLTRTEWERELIDACDWAGVPILGVCYGSQLLNAHYGGTLYQDILRDRPGTISHGEPTGNAMHEVTFASDFLGFESGEKANTAHRHHQAVAQIAPGFKAIATAPDGTIEAIAGRGHYGIQWHAESDGTAGRIYSAFIATCTVDELAPSLANLIPETETV